MGIFDALTSAVAGLQAQSFSLQNIAGNIANSQTTAYKRTDTSFVDIVNSIGASPSDAPTGSVAAAARSTNMISGPISSANVGTYMAVNGSGYFQVQNALSSTGGQTLLSGSSIFTRRGDFTMDRNGYLVNGAGNYLTGQMLEVETGAPVGSASSVLQFSSSALPPVASTRIDYQAILPQNPTSGMFGAAAFAPNGTGTALTAANAFSTIDLSADPTAGRFNFDLTDRLGTHAVSLSASDGVAGAIDIDHAVAAINSQLVAAGSDVTVSASSGKLVFTSNTVGPSGSVSIGTPTVAGTGVAATAADLGVSGAEVATTGAWGTPSPFGTSGTIRAQDNPAFLANTVDGSSAAAFTGTGQNVNVAFRWAKVSTGPDTWNLFYQAEPSATGSVAMWKNVGQDFKFNSDGKLTSPSGGKITVPDLTVGGMALGDIDIAFGSSGLVEYGSTAGSASVPKATADGHSSGQFTGLSIDNDGRVLASYSNHLQYAVAKIPLYTFNGEFALQPVDGGAYVTTAESGGPIMSMLSSIKGSSLEGSNTDIAAEFSKMIVTQQAYSANSKVITTANSMLQDVLNVVR